MRDAMGESLNMGPTLSPISLLTKFTILLALQTQEQKPTEMPAQPLKTQSLAPPPAAAFPDKQPEKPSPPPAKASNPHTPVAVCPF